jgi:hypothetical protein
MNRVLNLGFCKENEVNLKSGVDELMSSGLWHHGGLVSIADVLQVL